MTRWYNRHYIRLATGGCTVAAAPSLTVNLGKQDKLGGKQAHHATQWPRVNGLAASSGAWLTVEESQSVPTLGMLLRNYFTFSNFWNELQQLLTDTIYSTCQPLDCNSDFRLVQGYRHPPPLRSPSGTPYYRGPLSFDMVKVTHLNFLLLHMSSTISIQPQFHIVIIQRYTKCVASGGCHPQSASGAYSATPHLQAHFVWGKGRRGKG